MLPPPNARNALTNRGPQPRAPKEATGRAAQTQGWQVREGRPVTGAPNYGVGGRARAVGPGDAVTVEAGEHGRRFEPPGVPGLAHRRYGAHVPQRGDASRVGAALVEGTASGGGRVEQRAAVDVVGKVPVRTLGHPGQTVSWARSERDLRRRQSRWYRPPRDDGAAQTDRGITLIVYLSLRKHLGASATPEHR